MKQLTSCFGRSGSLAVILYFVLVSAVYAQSPLSRVGNVLFVAPEGWRRVEKDGATVFVAPDSVANRITCSITILPGEQLDGDFRKWYDSMLERAKSGFQVISGGGVTEA